MRQTRGGNQRIRRVTVEIKLSNPATNLRGDWPDVKPPQRFDHGWMIQIDIDAPAICEHLNFPHHDRADAAFVIGDQFNLKRPPLADERSFDDVCVQIEHST